jgi:hypothetical protein
MKTNLSRQERRPKNSNRAKRGRMLLQIPQPLAATFPERGPEKRNLN